MEKIDEGVILRYLQGKSTNEDFRKINKWIDISTDNQKYLFSIEEILAISKSNENDDKKTEAALIKLKSRIQSEEIEKLSMPEYKIKENSSATRKIQPFIGYAAAILAILIGGLSYIWLNKDEAINVYADNKIKKIELPDGTKIWLNEGSTLSYSKHFENNKRKVFLNGEAYFEVSKQPNKKTFIVESNMMNVEVRGTIFNMKSYSGNEKAETSLIEGEVLVETPDKDSRIILLPGQKAVFDRKRDRLTIQETNSNMDGVWRNAMIPFQNSSIEEIASVLKNLYNVNIIISKELNLESTYSGMIKKKDNLEEVMNALKNSIPIEYEIKNNTVIIKSKK